MGEMENHRQSPSAFPCFAKNIYEKKIRTQSKPLFFLILEPKPISWSNEKAEHSLRRQKIQWLDMGQLESITKII